MVFFRSFALLLCAEWLLLFRAWMSLKYLFLFMVVTVLRARLLNFIPHWDNLYFLYFVTLPAFLYHLRQIRRSARYREAYGTPEVGVSWLVIVARTDKAAHLLEGTIIGAFIAYMALYGIMVYPHGFGDLNPAWQSWLSEPLHAEMFALAYAMTGMFGLALWKQLDSGVPLWKSRTASGADSYQDVQEARRTPHKLPSVKELADEH